MAPGMARHGSGSPSGDGSKSNAGSGVEGESRSGSLRAEWGFQYVCCGSTEECPAAIGSARRALDKGDLAEAATAAVLPTHRHFTQPPMLCASE